MPCDETMATVSDEIAKFIEQTGLGFVATVTPDNKPNISPKGSIIRAADEQMAFADIRSPDTVADLASNSAIEVSVINPIVRRGYLFAGTGQVLKRGPQFDKLLARFQSRGIKNVINTIVVIDVQEITEVRSPLYDLGYTEEQIKKAWLDNYVS